MELMEEAIKLISDDATYTGKQVKELMAIVKQYVETEVQAKVFHIRFLQSIIDHYQSEKKE